MAKKTFTPEQIVATLRQIEVLLSQGKTVPLACKEAGIAQQTFYRWRKEYGGLKLDQAKRLKIDLAVRPLAVKMQAGSRSGRYLRFTLSALSSIPWIGGILSAEHLGPGGHEPEARACQEAPGASQ